MTIPKIPNFIDAETQIRFEKIVVGENPDKVLFALHGYGASADNLLTVVNGILHPNTVYIIPNGLEVCEGNGPINAIPNSGRQWFGVQNLATNVIAPKVASVTKILMHFITNQLNNLDIPMSKTVVFGFSQGAILASSLGVSAFPSLGGIIACSGCVMPIDEERIISFTPQTLIHGKQDNILPCIASETGLAELKQSGIDAEGYFLEDLKHSISNEVIQIINKQLIKYWK
ncbi:MAG: hypothetical protein JJW01_02770 [Alphaproteobacteria bacterium]|nr:hypothetical protein [Rickettsiales bacterium]